MEYFYIDVDKRYDNTPRINDFYHNFIRKEFVPRKCHNIKDTNVVYYYSKDKLEFVDILYVEVFLVTEKVREVFSVYEENMQFKTFIILNNVTNQSETYYAPIVDKIDCCIKEKSVYRNILTNFSKLVLNKEIVQDKSIFRVEGIDEDCVVVRLDVMESLLRRRIKGMKTKRVEVV